jgi:hypothetical protein
MQASQPEKVEERNDQEQKRKDCREWTVLYHYQLPSSLDEAFFLHLPRSFMLLGRPSGHDSDEFFRPIVG